MKISRDIRTHGAYFDPNSGDGLQLASEPESQDMQAEARTPTDEDAMLAPRELVTHAVKRQLVADVPLGCFLSGGIDSSIIAAAMKASVPKNQPVLTFSIGFEDPLYDESKYAEQVAKHLGTTHREFHRRLRRRRRSAEAGARLWRTVR